MSKFAHNMRNKPYHNIGDKTAVPVLILRFIPLTADVPFSSLPTFRFPLKEQEQQRNGDAEQQFNASPSP